MQNGSLSYILELKIRYDQLTNDGGKQTNKQTNDNKKVLQISLCAYFSSVVGQLTTYANSNSVTNLEFVHFAGLYSTKPSIFWGKQNIKPKVVISEIYFLIIPKAMKVSDKRFHFGSVFISGLGEGICHSCEH